MRIGWLLLLLASAAWAQPTPIRTVTSLPATCNGGTAGISSDTVVLVSGGTGVQYTCTAPNTWTATGSGLPSAFSAITAATNTAALTEGTGGSIAPTGVGQVDASTLLWTIGAPAPSFTMALTGGSFISGHAEAIRLTLITAAGQTLAGAEISLSNSTNGCAGGTTCTVTVTAPTVTCGALPCGGYVGYSVYNTDCGSVPCTGGELLVAGCSNITTNCTFGTAGAGAALPTTNTAFFQPSPLGTNVCSPATDPQLFIQDVSGSWFPYAGVDSVNTAANPPSPYNKISICRPIWINDGGVDPPGGRNALALIYHLQNGVTVSSANQDRGMFVYTLNALTDSSAHYGVEGIQVENDFNGTATITGSPDGEVAAGSFQLAQNNTAAYSSQAGTQAVRASMFREAGAVGDSQSNNGVNAQFVNISSVNGGGIQGNSVLATCQNAIGSQIAGVQCNGFKFTWSANPNTFGNGLVGIYFKPLGAYTPGANDFLIRTDTFGMPSNLNGPLTISQLINNLSTSTFPITGSVVVTPSITVSQASTGSLPGSGSCSGGASSYSYNFVGVDNNGGQVVGATITGATACTNPLTGGNPATITATMTSAQIEQFVRIDVYRAAGPMGLGKVGSLTCQASTPGGATCASFSDTGLVASGTLPTINTTGSAQAYKYATTTNCAAVGSGASPSLVACGSASAGSFSCATNASTATCVISTTAVTALSEIFVSQTSAKGTQLSVTCNTTADVPAGPRVASQSAGVSFTINLGTVAVNPACYDYYIVN